MRGESMAQYWRVATLLLTLVNVHSGSSFLFRRAEDRDSPDKVAHLRSRYWNDDIQPCIEKYCLPYVQKQRVYVQCLQTYCPAGLLAVPRDAESRGLAELLGAVLGGSPYCPGPTPACPPELCAAPGDLATLQDGVYSLCRAVLCNGVRGSDLDQCVTRRCCGQELAPLEAPDTRPEGLIPDTRPQGLSQPPAVTKRINDQLLQCMQSYCSGRGDKDSQRRCVRTMCHRSY